MAALGLPKHPQLLVGTETSDDAGVYLMEGGLGLVATVDFITPAVDDPYQFGQIAAANSLSDVYAMGGEPLTALNLVMFPAKKLGLSVLKDILQGGSDKIVEAGAVLLGGHSIEDEEPKYGLSVCGTVDPHQIWRNSTAQVGDALVLTKKLGSGVLLNATRADKFSASALAEEVIPSLTRLNQSAKRVAQTFEIHAATDVTGFGLLGHGLEMAKGAGLNLQLEYHRLPFFGGALEMYQKGLTTRSNKDNRLMASPFLKLHHPLTGAQEELLFDPQTSGGLLLALPSAQAVALVKALQQAGNDAACVIGNFNKGKPGIEVI
ncbi:MAG: selenide, water dikinase SelD [Candidatus Lambdaproteobacteria bacterium RIFOXYD2_FULL_50_16]|uniref:Selenide, water dikinase SelD n=1 Tax=Candidatus Lambdaproteobacteria bacterium RIFOXYD2_FULL_50_16 TaxID=1817772 RepID=A0A1F6G6I3_9PROT|nr:MAG: selenide, water dikinase SelD [Candidatus Lambdaproteobacteria bacterium RIFOXYD2_FULL_50_16]